MSENDTTNPITKAYEEGTKLENKEFELRKQRVDLQYQQLMDTKEKKEAFENISIGENPIERAKSLAKENREYIALAKDSATFLGMEEFKDKVALFPRNIILLGAETGTGKSTTVANFVLSFMKQGKKCLIITNEEYTLDILNRIVFLLNGWAYTDHNSITDKQLDMCDRMYPLLLEKFVEIIDDKTNKVGGTTTSFEGIQAVCNSLENKLSQGVKYDAVLVDYVQNIKYSNEAPHLPQWQVLDRLGAFLDGWKGVYPAPIILFSQLKSVTNNAESFKDRQEKFRAILNHCTTAIEIKVDRENLRTEWIFRKNRFKGAVGVSVFTGYDKGRYVEYTNEFKNKHHVKKEKNKHVDLLSTVLNK